MSTVNLVSQQKERFELYLRDKYSVVDISGANATEIPLKYLLQNHDIIVLTAQILVNALTCKSKEEQVNLEDISLLLFDECHHAHKEHSYNRIMERYLALKKQPRNQGSLPQVTDTSYCSSWRFWKHRGKSALRRRVIRPKWATNFSFSFFRFEQKKKERKFKVLPTFQKPYSKCFDRREWIGFIPFYYHKAKLTIRNLLASRSKI